MTTGIVTEKRSAPPPPLACEPAESLEEGRELSLSDLLKIENDASILDLRCTASGIPLWPQIRILVLRMLMSDLLYSSRLNTGLEPVAATRKALAFIGRAAARNLSMRVSRRCSADVCFVTDAVADQWMDGKWFNRLSDYFAFCTPGRTITMADHFEWRWPFPRRNDRLILHSPLQIRNSILSRAGVSAQHRRAARELVNFVGLRARDELGWIMGAEREQQLAVFLARKAAAAPWQYRGYESLLARIRPKLLLVSAACYGPAAALLAAANDAGVVTGEFQHGAGGAGHDAYNVAPAMRTSEAYRRTLPRCFLAYGAWWGEQMSVPVTKIVIGNPHREETLLRAPTASSVSTDILFLSDGAEFPKYVELARSTEPFARQRGLRVVIRPHPLERTRVLASHGESVGGIAVDPNTDLYASLRSAYAVVSEVSTGLFEAVGLVSKFFMWDTPKARFNYPSHPFESFASKEDLLQLLEREGAGRLHLETSEQVWATDWRRRYLDFVGGALG